MARRDGSENYSPVKRLEDLCSAAINAARKARRNRQNLSGITYYGNKLAELRADATNAFRDLTAETAGDVTAVAELIESVFAATTKGPNRARAAQELLFALRTTYRKQRQTTPSVTYFPQSILAQTNRGYLATIGRQLNGCFAEGWFDASAVMMRRLLEVSIIEAFEAKKVADKIKNSSGDYLMLTDLISCAQLEPSWVLSRNAKRALPKLKDVGHMSAHGRYFFARREDMERLQDSCRIAIEEFLHIAGLL
jgi:hypothetical protein